MKPADDTEDTKTVQYCIVGHGAGESGNSVIRTARERRPGGAWVVERCVL